MNDMLTRWESHMAKEMNDHSSAHPCPDAEAAWQAVDDLRTRYQKSADPALALEAWSKLVQDGHAKYGLPPWIGAYAGTGLLYAAVHAVRCPSDAFNLNRSEEDIRQVLLAGRGGKGLSADQRAHAFVRGFRLANGPGSNPLTQAHKDELDRDMLKKIRKAMALGLSLAKAAEVTKHDSLDGVSDKLRKIRRAVKRLGETLP